MNDEEMTPALLAYVSEFQSFRPALTHLRELEIRVLLAASALRAHGETGTAENLAEVRDLVVFTEARVEAAAFEAARRAMRREMEAGS